MRLLHTADFHAGKTLRGFDRTPEIRKALLEMVDLCLSEKVDAVLVAGDLFDNANPTADAENALFEFFLTLKEKGIPSVSIAGNHDSARRLTSVSGLLGWVGAQLVSELNPKNLLEAVKTVIARDGSLLKVAALPFLSERRLIKTAQLAEGDLGDWRLEYQFKLQAFINRLATGFDPSGVNVLMMHTTLEGAVNSGSESHFKFDIDNSYTVSSAMLPTTAQYVALGHIHKSQQVAQYPPAVYSGSPLQLDFGEAGDRKSVRLIDLEPGRPAQIHTLPLSSGKMLRSARVLLDDLDPQLEALRDFSGLLKVVVRVPPGLAVAGLKDRVMSILPNALSVELERLDGALLLEAASRQNLTPLELFSRYYTERRGELPDLVRDAFSEALVAVEEGELV